MNPGETALLCMDLQNDIVDPNGARGKGGNAQFVAQRNVLANVRRAQDAALEAGIVVVHVRVGSREDYADAIAVSPRFEGMRMSRALSVALGGASSLKPSRRGLTRWNSPSRASTRSSIPVF